MVSQAQNNLIQASLTPVSLSTDISVSVAKKTLDAQRQQGAQAVQLIDNAAPQPGDSLVAQATGLGSLLDLTA